MTFPFNNREDVLLDPGDFPHDGRETASSDPQAVSFQLLSICTEEFTQPLEPRVVFQLGRG